MGAEECVAFLCNTVKVRYIGMQYTGLFINSEGFDDTRDFDTGVSENSSISCIGMKFEKFSSIPIYWNESIGGEQFQNIRFS